MKQKFKVNFYPDGEEKKRGEIYKCDTIEEGSNGKILFKTDCRIVGIVANGAYESITLIKENINN